MGPTNIALVKLFRADQALREAQERLDAATKSVRIQERKVNDLTEKHKLTTAQFKELSAKSGNLDLDLRSRDEHIEKLRAQQSTAKNNKEYQAFLVEINTEKVDKAKTEEEAMKVMEQVESVGKQAAEYTTMLESERAKLVQMKADVGGTVAAIQAEIASLKAPRDAIADAMPPKAKIAFERLADHHDGEALSAILKPDRRKEEYVCSVCMMDLVTDVYNKLHTRDDMVFCASCRRILYIPADLPPELGVNKKKSSSFSSASSTSGSAHGGASETERPKEAPRAKGRLGELLTAAQGEAVKNAVDADQRPQEFHVTVDGKVMGIYKGKTGENLERIIRYRLEEAGLKHEVHVNPVVHETPETPVPAVAVDAPAAEPSSPEIAVEASAETESAEPSITPEQPATA